RLTGGDRITGEAALLSHRRSDASGPNTPKRLNGSGRTEGSQCAVPRDLQGLPQRTESVCGREDLDAPGTIESDGLHGVDEAGDVLCAFADEPPIVPRVFEQRPDDGFVGVAEFDTEDELGIKAPAQFVQRRSGPEDVPVVDDEAGGRMIDVTDEFGALGHRGDQSE